MINDTANPTTKRKVMITAITAAILFVIILILKTAKPETPAAETVEKLTLVSTGELTFTTMRPGFKTIGTLTAPAVTEITSQVQGTIKEVLIENGEKVIKGQPLILIDDVEQARLFSQAKAQYAQANAALIKAEAQHSTDLKLLQKDKELSQLARKSLERYKNLQKRNLATEAQVDQANETLQRQESSQLQRRLAVDTWSAQQAELEANLESAKAQFEQAEEDLASTEVTAPFSGRVHLVSVANAGRISKGSPLISLYDDQSVVLEASLPPTTMSLLMQHKELQKEMTASGSLWGQDIGFRFKSLAQRSNAQGNPVALFEPLQEFQTLAVNRGIEATITLPVQTNTYAIPVTALHDHAYIYLLKDDQTLDRVDVSIVGEAYQSDERFYIISAPSIKPGSAYVTSQMLSDINGLKVQPAQTQGQTL